MNDNGNANMRLEMDQPRSHSQHQLDLTDAERVAVTYELRRYGQMREDMAFDLTDGLAEYWAELCLDPRYSYGPQSDLGEAYEQESQHAYRMRDTELEQASLWFETADTVDQTGRLDLANPDTRFALNEVIENAGWNDPDPLSKPPDDLRRVVEAMPTAAEARAADRRFDESSWPVQQVGSQVEQPSISSRHPDHRMPPPTPESRARTP